MVVARARAHTHTHTHTHTNTHTHTHTHIDIQNSAKQNVGCAKLIRGKQFASVERNNPVG